VAHDVPSLRQCSTRRTGDGDGCATRTTESLDGEDLVVVVARLEAGLRLPGREVVGDGDGTGSALGSTDREELAEGSSADDRRLVGLGVRADLVGGAVAGQATTGCATVAAWVVAEVLNDVVL
jgi:hypothetical protein